MLSWVDIDGSRQKMLNAFEKPKTADTADTADTAETANLKQKTDRKPMPSVGPLSSLSLPRQW